MVSLAAMAAGSLTIAAGQGMTFNGFPRAVSDLGSDTRLTVGGTLSRASLSYSVLGGSPGTVRVTLGNEALPGVVKEVAELEAVFEPANACSCITVDVDALAARDDVALPSGDKYFVRFKNEAMDIQSGYLTIQAPAGGSGSGRSGDGGGQGNGTGRGKGDDSSDAMVVSYGNLLAIVSLLALSTAFV